MPTEPTLILLTTRRNPTSAAEVVGLDLDDSNILGLSLSRRAVLASRRAGFGRPVCLSDENLVLRDITTITNWNSLVAVLDTREVASFVIAPATVVVEADWLERLAQTQFAHSEWAMAPGRIVVLPSLNRETLSVLAAEGGAHTLAAIQERLMSTLGEPVPLPAGIDPLVLRGPADIRTAERRLLRALVKESDGFMARHVERPISLAISRFLVSTAVTPNQMTLISVAVGLIGAPFFLSPSALWQTVGALLLLLHSILDGCDGELARLKFQESRLGGILDFWGDNVVHSVIFFCMAMGWSNAVGAAWPLLLGVAAVAGTLGSAGFVYWRMLRLKDDTGPLYTSVSQQRGRLLTRLLDGLSRRDFIYLVVACAFFGKASWFLVLTALGAPIYFVLLLVLAGWERARPLSQPSQG